MKYSYIATEIDNEYRLKKAYEKSKRQKCKEKECINCQYFKICENGEKNDKAISIDSSI